MSDAAERGTPKIVNGVHVDNVLLSEHGHKFRAEFTRQQCVDEIRRVYSLAQDADRYLSRRFFRDNSIISDGTWDRYFGTFEQFKRSAGIELSRGAHRMELNISAHAARDIYREWNKEKQGYEGKYLKPHDKAFQIVLGCNDIHDIMVDPFWELVFLDTCKRVQPDKVVINGDLFDLAEFGRYNVDPREWDVVGRIRKAHGFLEAIRSSCPDTEIIVVEGNHEFRLLRHLADQSPAMRVVLSDLHGFTVSKLLGLDAYEVNYISRTDLAAWNVRDIKTELKKNYWFGYECLVAGHYPEMVKMGFPGWNGHHHRHVVQTRFNPILGTYEWHQFGAGHRRVADYCDGEHWSNGFGIIHVHVPTKSVAIEYVDVRDFAVVGGKYYVREDSK